MLLQATQLPQNSRRGTDPACSRFPFTAKLMPLRYTKVTVIALHLRMAVDILPLNHDALLTPLPMSMSRVRQAFDRPCHFACTVWRRSCALQTSAVMANVEATASRQAHAGNPSVPEDWRKACIAVPLAIVMSSCTGTLCLTSCMRHSPKQLF
jgi:hypothetical protein